MKRYRARFILPLNSIPQTVPKLREYMRIRRVDNRSKRPLDPTLQPAYTPINQNHIAWLWCFAFCANNKES